MNTRRRPEYQAWLAMKGRCLNTRHEAFKNYGGRGIRICPEWIDSFLVFLEDMGERTSAKHSLDRIDNDGNYEPGNCRWATRVQQNSNTRRRAKSGCIGVYPASRGRGWQAVAELERMAPCRKRSVKPDTKGQWLCNGQLRKFYRRLPKCCRRHVKGKKAQRRQTWLDMHS